MTTVAGLLAYPCSTAFPPEQQWLTECRTRFPNLAIEKHIPITWRGLTAAGTAPDSDWQILDRIPFSDYLRIHRSIVTTVFFGGKDSVIFEKKKGVPNENRRFALNYNPRTQKQ